MTAALPFRCLSAPPAHPDTVPLVALHGFLGSSEDWAGLAARLPGRAVAGIDLPGHGAATGLAAPAYAFDAAVDALAVTFGAHGIARADLLGYSMGGRVALAFALRYPERLRTLTLESASAGLETDDARTARRALDAERADALVADLPGFLRRWVAMPLFATLTPEQRRALVADRSRSNPHELARGLVGMGTGAMPDLWPHLGTLTCPVRLVAGSEDAKFVALARRMADRMPDAALHVVDGAGHNVHLERPDVFARLLA